MQPQRSSSEPSRQIFNYFADDPAARAQAQRTVLLSEPPSSANTSASEEVSYQPPRIPTEAEVGPRQGPYRHRTRPEQYQHGALDEPTTDDSPRDVQLSRSLPQLLPNAETVEARQYANQHRRTQSQGSTDSQRRPYARLLPRSPLQHRHGTTERENPQDQ